MFLINCEINLDLHLPKNCIIAVTNVADQVITLSITDTKLYVPVVVLSTQDNEKLFEQLKSDFKRTKSKKSIKRPNQYLDYFFDLSFQWVNRLFVLSFENEA